MTEYERILKTCEPFSEKAHARRVKIRSAHTCILDWQPQPEGPDQAQTACRCGWVSGLMLVSLARRAAIEHLDEMLTEAVRRKQQEHPFPHHGVSKQRREELAKLQKGRCGICGDEKLLCLDHDHRTGEARLMLCHTCNVHVAIVEKAIRLGRVASERYERAQIYLHDRPWRFLDHRLG